MNGILHYTVCDTGFLLRNLRLKLLPIDLSLFFSYSGGIHFRVGKHWFLPLCLFLYKLYEKQDSCPILMPLHYPVNFKMCMQICTWHICLFLLPVAYKSVKFDRVSLKVAQRQIATAQLPHFPHNVSLSEYNAIC